MRKKRFVRKLKPLRETCLFCEKKIEPSWKENAVLERFLTQRGKILGRTRNGCCAKHQRRLMKETKRARHLALLPFVAGIQ